MRNVVLAGGCAILTAAVLKRLFNAQRRDVLSGFKLKEVLKSQEGMLILLGEMGGAAAIVIVNRMSFDEQFPRKFLESAWFRQTHHNDVYRDFIGQMPSEASPLKVEKVGEGCIGFL